MGCRGCLCPCQLSWRRFVRGILGGYTPGYWVWDIRYSPLQILISDSYLRHNTYAAHCPKNNLNLCIKTMYVTVGTEATALCNVYVHYVCEQKPDIDRCIRSIVIRDRDPDYLLCLD